MIRTRRSHERGHTQLDWLDSYHTFSFDQYYDPEHMGFRSLRVLNEDRVKSGAGFPLHSHRDMEILTYVLEGALAHKDSTGAGSVLRPGEVQHMSAGSGIRHSEYNASTTHGVHFLQVWILPEKKNIKPGYEQRPFPIHEQPGILHLLASGERRNDVLRLNQDAAVYAAELSSGDEISTRIKPNRFAWIQLAKGSATINGIQLKAGDGAAISEEETLIIASEAPSEFLLFDLA